ncbi:MAG: immunity 17 family protein [Mediterranea sp.]|jgi:hypothetical protein|nr:immunity 17 family protein [Mediterranea sp.]
MTGQYITQAIFALAGSIALLAAVFNWEWFFATRSAKGMTSHVSRTKARLFYGSLGIIIIGMATFFFVATLRTVAQQS